MNKIEIGLRKFHKFPLDEGLIFIHRPLYQKDEAYLWRYPSGDVITYGSDVKLEKIDALNRFLPQDHHDGEYILNPKNYQSHLNQEYLYTVLNKNDSEAFEKMKVSCSKSDLSYGQITLDDAIVVGAFHHKEMVAAASIWNLEEDLVDIGVITHSKYRNQGLGSSVVSYLIENLPKHKIALYRADYDNPGSVHIAKKLGFDVYCHIYRIIK